MTNHFSAQISYPAPKYLWGHPCQAGSLDWDFQSSYILRVTTGGYAYNGSRRRPDMVPPCARAAGYWVLRFIPVLTSRAKSWSFVGRTEYRRSCVMRPPRTLFPIIPFRGLTPTCLSNHMNLNHNVEMLKTNNWRSGELHTIPPYFLRLVVRFFIRLCFAGNHGGVPPTKIFIW
jgi:hypothetical protein